MKTASIVDCSMEQGRARARMHRVNHESTISLDHNERSGDNVPEVIFQSIFLMVKLERTGCVKKEKRAYKKNGLEVSQKRVNSTSHSRTSVGMCLTNEV